MRLVCVDDDDAFLDLVSWIAAERGWEVSLFQDAETALPEIARRPPHLILLDLRLEGLSGWDMITLLGRDARTVGLPIILCSAAVDEVQGRLDDLRRHGIRFLPKPFDVDELYGVVAEVAAESGRARLTGA